MIDTLSQIVEFIQNIHGNEVNQVCYLALVFIVFIVSIMKEANDLKKGLDKDFNLVESFMHTIIGGTLGCCLLYLMGGVSFPFSTAIGCIAGIVVYDKYIVSVGNQQVVIKIDNEHHDEVRKPAKDIPEEHADFSGLDKDGNYDILDTLFAYGYISKNHYQKILRQSLFETPDEMAKKLLEMRVLTDCELQEARAIMNLNRLENRHITKEEALKYLIEYEKNNPCGGK